MKIKGRFFSVDPNPYVPTPVKTLQKVEAVEQQISELSAQINNSEASVGQVLTMGAGGTSSYADPTGGSGDTTELELYVGKPSGENLHKGYTKRIYPASEGYLYTVSTDNTRCSIIPIQYGKTYSITKGTGGNRFRVAVSNYLFNKNINATKSPCTLLVDNNEQTTYEYTHDQKWNGYLYVLVSADGTEPTLTVTSADHVTENAMLDKGQLVGDFVSYYKSADCDSVATGESFDLAASTSANIYTAYDALVTAHPTRIYRTLLGYGSKADGTADTKPIYEYAIKKYPRPTCPVILIIAGVHGDEKSSVWSLLQFVTQLLSDYDTNASLRAIIDNTVIKIIPIVNPCGYDANTRNNLRNVNINRNFSPYWADAAGGEKGSAAYSELESQVVRDWLALNKYASVFIDYHNTLESVNEEAYISTPNRQLDLVYASLSRRLQTQWEIDYSGTTIENFNIYNLAWPTVVQEAYVVNGIKLAAILEIVKSEGGVNYTNVVIQEGVDQIANYILAVLNYANTTGLLRYFTT